MRGKGGTKKYCNRYHRITPAYAGKRQRQRTRSLRFWDHPRLCGEKLCRQRGFRRNTGSPPPMRGKAIECSFFRKISRITPAYAGKSKYIHLKTMQCQDHPRLCGEKVRVTVETSVYPGSPPPMRGKVKNFQQCT